MVALDGDCAGAAGCREAGQAVDGEPGATAETLSLSPVLAALRSQTRSAREKRSIARSVVDENLLQTPTRQRNRMSSSLNTHLK